MAREAQRDGLDGTRHGLTLEGTVAWRHVAGEALAAGAVAAAIGAAASAAPHMARALRAAIRSGEVDLDALREGGREALGGAAAGGVRGAVAAGVVSAARAGALGEAMKSVSPAAVGAVVAASLSIMADTYALAQGGIDQAEYGRRVTVTSLTSAAAYGGAAVGQTLIPVPVVGAMLGGIVGSALGSAGFAGASVALQRLDDPAVVEAHVDIARGVGGIAATVEHGVVRLHELARRRVALDASLAARVTAWERARRRAAADDAVAATHHEEALALADDHDARLAALLAEPSEAGGAGGPRPRGPRAGDPGPGAG